MTGIKQLNVLAKIQRWINSVAGKTFMNYAYNWGAAIVVLGALFKITHLPGGNLMLFIGMGTEVFVFFISAFDKPFDADLQREIAEAEAEDAAMNLNKTAVGGAVGGGIFARCAAGRDARSISYGGAESPDGGRADISLLSDGGGGEAEPPPGRCMHRPRLLHRLLDRRGGAGEMGHGFRGMQRENTGGSIRH